MADAVQYDDVGIGDDLTKTGRDVEPGHGILRADDQPQRHRGVGQRRRPPIPPHAPLVLVAAHPVRHPQPVIVDDQRPELAQLAVGGPVGRAEHAGETAAEHRLGHQAGDHRSGDPVLEDPLNEQRVSRLRKQPAVEQRHRPHRQTVGAPTRALGLPRQQLLRDRHAVVMGQHVRGADAESRQQCLDQRGLFEEAVRVTRGFVREPEAEHVGRDHAKPSGQLRPQAMPVPRRRREAVNANERLTRARLAVKDPVFAPAVVPAAALPVGDVQSQ